MFCLPCQSCFNCSKCPKDTARLTPNLSCQQSRDLMSGVPASCIPLCLARTKPTHTHLARLVVVENQSTRKRVLQALLVILLYFDTFIPRLLGDCSGLPAHHGPPNTRPGLPPTDPVPAQRLTGSTRIRSPL